MSQSLVHVDYSRYLAQPSDAERELQRLFAPTQPLVIFDVGACEGEESVRYARRFPAARIYAFEPLPANQPLVRATFARYAVDRAELVPLALSDRAGEAVFHVSSGRPRDEFSGSAWNYGNKSSSLLPPASHDPMYGWLEFKESVVVPTETLDSFCSARKIDRVDFVHLDVQGAERLVLAGARAMLPRIGAIWIEVSDRELYAGQVLRSEIETIMRQNGFALGHEVRREIEGDQFYVNLRDPRSWRYLARRRVSRALMRTRMFLGRGKSALLGRSTR